MDGKIQTSFIPKKPLIDSSVRHSSSVGLFSLIGYGIFFVTLILLGGVLFWQHSLNSTIASLDVSLQKKQQAIDPTLIDSLAKLDARIETAKKILASHLALSHVFPLIADNTLQSIQFSDFNYALSSGKITIAMSGVSPNFSSVALQEDTFAKEPMLVDQSISGLSLSQNGQVSFKFAATVNPIALSYKNSITAGAAAAGGQDMSTSTSSSGIQ